MQGKAWILMIISILLAFVSITLSYLSVQTSRYWVTSAGFGTEAEPPSHWAEIPWAVVEGYRPNATLILENGTLHLSNVTPYFLGGKTIYIYNVSGVIQPDYYL